jgi:hypothetical protein
MSAGTFGAAEDDNRFVFVVAARSESKNLWKNVLGRLLAEVPKGGKQLFVS